MDPTVIAVDTSLVVAGLSPWHERHEVCRSLLDDRPAIVGHALVESFSVLTRLRVPYKVSTGLAAELLIANFAAPPLVLTSEQVLRFVESLRHWKVAGGAVYDALIATTARDHGATLFTLDTRASRTYLAVGADTRLI